MAEATVKPCSGKARQTASMHKIEGTLLVNKLIEQAPIEVEPVDDAQRFVAKPADASTERQGDTSGTRAGTTGNPPKN